VRGADQHGSVTCVTETPTSSDPSDTSGPSDADREALRRAAEDARAHVDAVRAVARFVEDLEDLPDPSALAEFAHLLTQEEETREARTGALADIGLSVPSLDPDPE
jgi:ferric-dicitrate binding protein FerR (iron transport regulator)